MSTVLLGPLFLLVFALLDGPVSPLIGAKLAVPIFFSTGVIAVGFGWHAVMAGGCDIALLLGGAALARRFGLSTRPCRMWMRRVTLAFSAVLVLLFAALATIAVLLTGPSHDSIAFGLGCLMSAGSAAILLLPRQEQVFTWSGAGSLVSASPQA